MNKKNKFYESKKFSLILSVICILAIFFCALYYILFLKFYEVYDFSCLDNITKNIEVEYNFSQCKTISIDIFSEKVFYADCKTMNRFEEEKSTRFTDEEKKFCMTVKHFFDR